MILAEYHSDRPSKTVCNIHSRANTTGTGTLDAHSQQRRQRKPPVLVGLGHTHISRPEHVFESPSAKLSGFRSLAGKSASHRCLLRVFIYMFIHHTRWRRSHRSGSISFMVLVPCKRVKRRVEHAQAIEPISNLSHTWSCSSAFFPKMSLWQFWRSLHTHRLVMSAFR